MADYAGALFQPNPLVVDQVGLFPTFLFATQGVDFNSPDELANATDWTALDGTDASPLLGLVGGVAAAPTVGQLWPRGNSG